MKNKTLIACDKIYNDFALNMIALTLRLSVVCRASSLDQNSTPLSLNIFIGLPSYPDKISQ